MGSWADIGSRELWAKLLVAEFNVSESEGMVSYVTLSSLYDIVPVISPSESKTLIRFAGINIFSSTTFAQRICDFCFQHPVQSFGESAALMDLPFVLSN